MKSMYHKAIDGDIRWIEYYDYLYKRKGYTGYNEYCSNRKYEFGLRQPMSENELCASYLGIYVAEDKYAFEILSNIYKYVVHMSYGNKGCDYRCSNDNIHWDKIDIKSSCILKKKDISSSGCEFIYDVLSFRIYRNKVADYFILLAFDNRDYLNPIKVWLVKGTEIIRGRRFNDFVSFGIRISKINDFKKYELTDKLEKLKECCNKTKFKE